MVSQQHRSLVVVACTATTENGASRGLPALFSSYIVGIRPHYALSLQSPGPYLHNPSQISSPPVPGSGLVSRPAPTLRHTVARVRRDKESVISDERRHLRRSFRRCPYPGHSQQLSLTTKSAETFLTKVGVTAAGVAAAFVTVPAIAFLLGLRKSPSSWRSLGHMDDFKIGETVEVYIYRSIASAMVGRNCKNSRVAAAQRPSNEFVAFAIYCTHLGCPVRWIPTANLFMCPCHGGVFYGDGTRRLRAASAAARHLSRARQPRLGRDPDEPSADHYRMRRRS